MSVTVGDVVLGVVGSKHRHAVALVGPSVSVGARLLKQVAPGGIIATGEVVEALRAEMPHLARDFRLLDPVFEVPATDGLVVATWTIGPDAREADTCASGGLADADGHGTGASPNKDIEPT
jgi:class 3 adenylate cyclase